jgi:hypothetical protein
MDVIHFTRGADPRSIRVQIRRTSLLKKLSTSKHCLSSK